MNPTSVDIKDLLVQAGVGVFSTDLFIGREPAQPSNCITVYDTGGGAQNPRFAIDEANIQVRARNIGYTDGYGKLEQVKKALEGLPQTTVNNATYIGIWASTNIAFLKYDEQERAMFSINFRVQRQPTQADAGRRQVF